MTTPTITRAEFICAKTGAVAATLTLTGDELVQDGFLGRITELVPARFIGPLRATLTAADADALYALNSLWAPFYCPECRAVYASGVWNMDMQFEQDDDPLGGMPNWYDCTYGVCPEDHRRLIDD